MQSGTGYVVVSAPPGAVVHAVPAATTVVYVGTTPYYYIGGTYYVATTDPAPQSVATGKSDAKEESVAMIEGEDKNNYKVVAPPVGATVPYVPEEATKKKVKGKEYFVYSGTYYQAFASGGETIFMVVEDPKKASPTKDAAERTGEKNRVGLRPA